MKYMSDIVDAGGRLTQAYDSFLNVCADTSAATAVLISRELTSIAGLLRCCP
jgi:hypothetical protein